VPFLFTDVEGSTRRWEADADGMRAALAAHDEVLRGAPVAATRSRYSSIGQGINGSRVDGRRGPLTRRWVPLRV
jgi:hypothetical protein